MIVDNKEDIIPLDTYSKNISNKAEIKKTEDNIVLSSEEKRDVLQEIMDTSLLKNPLFLIFTLSNFCTSIGFNVPYVYLLVKINLLFTFLKF